jgi:hypothetical protein
MMELFTATDILDSFKPQSPEHYRRGFLEHLKRNGRKEKPQTTTLKAGIDHGRWVTKCPCGGAIALHPQWQFAACLTCGRSWTSIEFPPPELLAKIEAIVTLRARGVSAPHQSPKRFWTWSPEETLEDLRRKNRRHGWEVPPEEVEP